PYNPYTLTLQYHVLLHTRLRSHLHTSNTLLQTYQSLPWRLLLSSILKQVGAVFTTPSVGYSSSSSISIVPKLNVGIFGWFFSASSILASDALFGLAGSFVSVLKFWMNEPIDWSSFSSFFGSAFTPENIDEKLGILVSSSCSFGCSACLLALCPNIALKFGTVFSAV